MDNYQEAVQELEQEHIRYKRIDSWYQWLDSMPPEERIHFETIFTGKSYYE